MGGIGYRCGCARVVGRHRLRAGDGADREALVRRCLGSPLAQPNDGRERTAKRVARSGTAAVGSGSQFGHPSQPDNVGAGVRCAAARRLARCCVAA